MSTGSLHLQVISIQYKGQKQKYSLGLSGVLKRMRLSNKIISMLKDSSVSVLIKIVLQ